MQSFNISSRRGDTYDGQVFEILINGSALDLTDAIISLEARVRGSDLPALLLNTTSGLTILLPMNSGLFQIDPIIFPMDEGVYYYDTSFNINGRVKTYIEGNISIYMDAHYG